MLNSCGYSWGRWGSFVWNSISGRHAFQSLERGGRRDDNADCFVMIQWLLNAANYLVSEPPNLPEKRHPAYRRWSSEATWGLKLHVWLQQKPRQVVAFSWTPQSQERLSLADVCRRQLWGSKRLNLMSWVVLFCFCMFLHSPEKEHEFHGPWVHDYRYRTQDFPKECFQKPIWAPEPRWSLLQQKAGRIMSLPIGIWRDSWKYAWKVTL